MINVVGLRQHGLEIDHQILPDPVVDLVSTSSHGLVVATGRSFLRNERREPDPAVGSESVPNLADSVVDRAAFKKGQIVGPNEHDAVGHLSEQRCKLGIEKK